MVCYVNFFAYFHTRVLLTYPALWFVVRWLEDEDELFDVLPAKDITSEDGPVHLIETGMKCQGRYFGKMYPVRIIAKGMFLSLYMYACLYSALEPPTHSTW